MTDLWRIRSSAHTSLHTGVAKLAASMTASAHRGQAELREPYTDADAHAALRMVTQNSLDVADAAVTAIVQRHRARCMPQSPRWTTRSSTAPPKLNQPKASSLRVAQPSSDSQLRQPRGAARPQSTRRPTTAPPTRTRERSTPLNGRRTSFFHYKKDGKE